MAAERLSMRTIREILRLKWERHLPNKMIAESCNIARSTVRDYLSRAGQAGLSWPLPAELDDSLLEQMNFKDYKDTVPHLFHHNASATKRTTVQNLKTAIEIRLQRLLERNPPLRTDFQRHYEQIVAEYNREKDRVTIEQTFEALMRFIDEMSEEEIRAFREGLDEESLAVFDLLKKPDLTAGEIKKVKAVAVDLLKTLKEEKLRITRWQDKEATRDAVRQAILDFLWNDSTGLPVDKYTEGDVQVKADDVYRHVYRVYPTLPSPYYPVSAAV